MSGATTKYAVPYPVLADTVASLAATVQNLANRVDLLLGESGSYNIASLAAGTVHNQAIVLARTYPGNNAAAVPGFVIVELQGAISSANPWVWYVDTFTGSTSTLTGFTIHTQWAGTQTNRVVTWRFIPVL